MEKLWLIIKREYSSRVKKKSFIITTLLTPIAIGLFMIAAGLLINYEGEEQRHIAVLDDANILGTDSINIKEENGLTFEKVTGSVNDHIENEKFNAILELPPIAQLKSKEYTVKYHSSEGILGIGLINKIENEKEKNIYQYKADAFGFNKDSLESLKTQVTLDRESIGDAPKNISSEASIIATGIGGAMGFIMYFAVFLYGMMVMRSVTEEKTNRIVEVMVSSVKPFQLMMGKIIGVALVGLTQVAIWAILIPIIFFIAIAVSGIDMTQAQDMQSQMGGVDIKELESQFNPAKFVQEIFNQNWLVIIPLFIIYFIGGYMMYSSLFAAVGSAMNDDLSENQSLTLPITLPVIAALYMMFSVVQNPNSSMAVWASLVPFFSPIIMPARLAFEPPLWQIVLSVVILIASVIFFVWLSARIYRVGILMYGKKVTFKELGKWLFYKD